MGNSSSSSSPSTGRVDAPGNINIGDFEFAADVASSNVTSRFIGRGSFGTVSIMRRKRGSGNPKRDETCYAVKSISKAKLLASGEVEQILRELQILKIVATKKKRCDYIVNLRFAFQDPTTLYLVSDLCEGGSVSYLLKREKTFHPRRARRYFAELARALIYLHVECDILHRDVKSDNLLIDRKGRLRITDFNLSLHLGTNRKKAENHKSGWGTRGLRAPEIYLRSGSGWLFMCDWYSAGATLYEMLTGKLPFLEREDNNEGKVGDVRDEDGEKKESAKQEKEEDESLTVSERERKNKEDLIALLRRVYKGSFDTSLLTTAENEIPFTTSFIAALLKFEPSERLGDAGVLNHPYLLGFDPTTTSEGLWVPTEGNKTTPTFSSASPKADGALDANFDPEVDKAEQLRQLNLAIETAFGGYDEDVEVEATYELTTLDAKEQETFARWRFNHESPLSYDDADGDAPEFALLQAFGAMSDPKKMREFVAKAPDGVLLALAGEVRELREAMLLENFKYLTAEMRCDELFKRNLELKSLVGEEAVERERDKNLVREATRKPSLEDGRVEKTETAPREDQTKVPQPTNEE